jgi:acetyl esterase/lipase
MRIVLAALALTLISYSAVAQAPRVEYTRTSDVIYGRAYGLALTMEVFTPKHPNGRGVIWVVSSGGYSSRDRTEQPSFEKRISPLLERGYVVFAVVHGSSPMFNVESHARDVRRAIRVVRHRAAEFSIDPVRIGLVGSSSGGVVALLIAMTGEDGEATSEDPVDRISSRVQAVGAFFPGTDLVNFGEDGRWITDVMRQGNFVDPSFEFYDVDPLNGRRTPVSEVTEIQRRLRQLSSVTHVTADDPPTILIHGDRDTAAPIQQSRRLFERLQAMKVPTDLVVREGMGHAWPGWESDSALVATWFDKFLRQ